MATKSGKKDAIPTSVRVSALCRKLWDELAGKHGLTRTAYLEMVIRRLAREENMDVENDG